MLKNTCFGPVPCGQFVDRIPSTRRVTGRSGWERCKTLENLRWLQLLKRQRLTFLPDQRFGTVRSVVRILSPRPIIQQLTAADDALGDSQRTANSRPFSS